MGVLLDIDEDVRVELDLVWLLLVDIDLELLDLIDDEADLVFELVIVIWKPYQTLRLGSSPQILTVLVDVVSMQEHMVERKDCADDNRLDQTTSVPETFT